jgi:hypothetical protein
VAKRGERKSNRLSKEEAEALVRQSHEAVFGPGPAGIVSRLTFAAGDVVAKVHAIDWFVNCGKPHDFDLTMPVTCVKTWPQATKALKSRAWENATLEARNQLSAYLSRHHRERYREWNNITDKFKREVVFPLQEREWEPFRQSHELDIKFIHSLQWNVLAALMEHAHMDCGHGCYFFHELVAVYEAGHLPCGWIGKWPYPSIVATAL